MTSRRASLGLAQGYRKCRHGATEATNPCNTSCRGTHPRRRYYWVECGPLRISVIMPVCAYPKPADPSGGPHPYLTHALDSVLRAAHEDVEILIGIDGERPRVRDAVEAWRDAHRRVRLHVEAFPFRRPCRYGNTQRNALMAKATGEYLHFNDHDDHYVEGALARVAAVARRHPGRPIVGKMRVFCWGNQTRRLDPPVCLWSTRGCVKRGQIGGHMLVAPNRQHLLGRFAPEESYTADFEYVQRTLRAFRANGLPEVWIEDVIAECRPWMPAE
jgi:hypothetical protein